MLRKILMGAQREAMVTEKQEVGRSLRNKAPGRGKLADKSDGGQCCSNQATTAARQVAPRAGSGLLGVGVPSAHFQGSSPRRCVALRKVVILDGPA